MLTGKGVKKEKYVETFTIFAFWRDIGCCPVDVNRAVVAVFDFFKRCLGSYRRFVDCRDMRRAVENEKKTTRTDGRSC